MKKILPFLLIAIVILSLVVYGFWSKILVKQEKPPADGQQLGTLWQLKPEEEVRLNFAQIEEVVLDREGQKLIFWADDPVKDITFTQVEWHETKGYKEKTLLYTLDHLDPDRAIRLIYFLPETIPNLKLGFTLKDGSRREFLIAQSGQDGSILLIDPKA